MNLLDGSYPIRDKPLQLYGSFPPGMSRKGDNCMFGDEPPGGQLSNQGWA